MISPGSFPQTANLPRVSGIPAARASQVVRDLPGAAEAQARLSSVALWIKRNVTWRFGHGSTSEHPNHNFKKNVKRVVRTYQPKWYIGFDPRPFQALWSPVHGGWSKVPSGSLKNPVGNPKGSKIPSPLAPKPPWGFHKKYLDPQNSNLKTCYCQPRVGLVM